MPDGCHLRRLRGRGGKIGRALAERVSVPFIDRAVRGSNIHQAADALRHVTNREAHVSDAAERALAELGTRSQLFRGQGTGSDSAPIDGNGYGMQVREAITWLAKTSGAVVLGNGAVGVLRFDPNALRVAVTAPREMRLKRVMAAEDVDRETAKRRLDAADEARRAYLRRFYDLDTDEPGLLPAGS